MQKNCFNVFMNGTADGNDKYMLYADVVHVDMLNTLGFGHYICYTNDLFGNWYRINDSKVESPSLCAFLDVSVCVNSVHNLV